jgi:ATP-binding cassette subfamily F protein 3
LFDYPGNYSWFLEKRESTGYEPGETRKKSDAGREERAKREIAAQERRALKKEIASIEARIENGERRRGEIDVLLCAPDTLSDSARVQSLMKERSELERVIAGDYAKWEEMMSNWA